jgi:hypothetical protein
LERRIVRARFNVNDFAAAALASEAPFEQAFVHEVAQHCQGCGHRGSGQVLWDLYVHTVAEDNRAHRQNMADFADLLGKPREGFHAKRMMGDVAQNDVAGTVAIAMLASVYWDIPLWKTVAGLFIAGELAHLAVGVDTAVIVRLKNMLKQ